MRLLRKFQYNSPVVLTFALISLLVLGLNELTDGGSNWFLFSVYRSSWKNPLTYLRFFGHVLGHSDWSHYMNNMLMILVPKTEKAIKAERAAAAKQQQEAPKA